MRAIISLLVLLFCTKVAIAQDIILTPIGESLCSPGVVNKSPGKGIFVEYGTNPTGSLNGLSNTGESTTSIGLNPRFMFKLKAPIVNKKTMKLLVGWNFYGEEYNFNTIGDDNASVFQSIDGQYLKSSRLSIYLIRPINHKYYFGMKAVASYNGDYSGMFNFDKRYTRYDLALIFGVKKRPTLEYGFGLLVRRNFLNSFPVLPFGIYNQTFNDKWGLEATIPTSVLGRYNINEKHLVLFGPQFESRSYSINVSNATTEDFAPYTMRRSELRLAVKYNYNVKGWLWLEGSTGYVRNFTTRFEVDANGNSTDEIRVTPSNGAFFKFGLFLSPPKSKMK